MTQKNNPADNFKLGAIDKNTNQYIPLSQAKKGHQYKCIDCGNDLKFHKGKKLKPHFAHKVKVI